jgi:hypothetical protein
LRSSLSSTRSMSDFSSIRWLQSIGITTFSTPVPAFLLLVCVLDH